MSKMRALLRRGNFTESIHNIKCYLGSVNDETLYSTEDDNDIIYPRSAIKIFQGIPFATSKAIDLFNLNKKQVALSCSSHCGEKFHIKELKNWLEKTKLKPYKPKTLQERHKSKKIYLYKFQMYLFLFLVGKHNHL